MTTIKKTILLALTALMMVGCEYSTDAEIEERERLKGFNVVVIDSCEYLKGNTGSGYQGYGYFAHKGNCKFCAERRRQGLQKLIQSIKEE